jgi:alkanesulfonate monooxygenase SsuD/methylene tetrahydromethanopterin reductase-like flavin-dependent oxidoreductase (luciferase family)
MLRLAAREADGAILNWLAADDVPKVLPYLRRDADPAEVVARIFVAPGDDPEAARAVARRAIAGYLTVGVYRAFHEWLGRGGQLAAMWRAWEAGDRRAALAAIPDEVVDALVVHGPPAACRERVLGYVEAGVTTPVIALLPVGGDVGELVRGLAPAAG